MPNTVDVIRNASVMLYVMGNIVRTNIVNTIRYRTSSTKLICMRKGFVFCRLLMYFLKLSSLVFINLV